MIKKPLLVAVSLCVALFLGGNVFATIVGSDHDLSIAGQNVCYSCHTPHSAGSIGEMPLWQKRTSTLGAFTLYSSPTLDATLNQPDSIDAACLYCHSGTIAVDEWAGGSTLLTGDEVVGIDLSNDHPVSFTYDSTLAATDGELVDPIDDAGSGITPFPLFAGKMRCASCHKVHDDTISPFLRLDDSDNTFCTKCHIK